MAMYIAWVWLPPLQTFLDSVDTVRSEAGHCAFLALSGWFSVIALTELTSAVRAFLV